jgi:hypothetical protein
MGYGLDGRGFYSRLGQQSFLRVVQTGSGAHATSYAGGKAAEA